MNTKPLISILIPCYNHAKYVCQTLDSVMEDEYPKKEIIIINDGSSDNSDAVIEKWIKEHEGLISIDYANRPNKGICVTLNELISKAKGEYVVLLASDDMLCHNMIEKRLLYLQQNPSKKIVIGNAIVIDEDNNILSENSLEFHGGSISDYKDKSTALNTLLFGKWGFIGPLILAKKILYDDIGLYKESLTVEDHYFFLRVINDNSFVFIDDIVAKYRIHDKSLSHNLENLFVNNISIFKSYIYAYKYFDFKNRLLLLKAIFKRLKALLFFGIKRLCKNIALRIVSYPILDKAKYIFRYKYFLRKRGFGCYIKPALLITPWFIELGNNVFIEKNARIQGINCYRGETFNPNIILCDGVTIQQNIHLTCAKYIIIGSNTAIAANVTITDIHHSYEDINVPIEKQKIVVKPVRIGENSKIYNNVVVLPGANIGRHVTVGANSIVTGNIPNYCVAAGAPAKVIKRYNFERKQWEKTNAQGDFLE